ncbi:conserved hypothetical protein [Ktedonobacter racemifer DSM 44963]|uniref:Uncharacterized protein n=1 Tax=Ktedonobacter racemifer DSM 44963 TaxID=485913 RepID=D6U4J6_KTERA|nr:conserved hypothetical protein [Ktedonobacter racemifer DSM 44963]
MGLFPKRQSKLKNPLSKLKKKPLLPLSRPKKRKTRKKFLGIFGKGK